MDKIMSTAKKNNLSVIEDCAHAIGTKFKKKHVGTIGDFGCFSFYPTKNITTLEGGMIITNSKKHAKYNQLIRNHGITKTLRDRYVKGIPWEYDVVEPGYNYRLDEVRSSLGINQLKSIKSINSKRRKAFQYYVKHLSGIDGIITPIIHELENQSCHLFIIKIKKDEFGYDRNHVYKKLLSRGIRTSVHYKPLHLLSLFKKTKIYDELQNSKILFEQMLSLPFFTNISKKEQDMVINELKNIKNN
jgi:dTDP-4-amino-4,6-dideoxygalactose transaminase